MEKQLVTGIAYSKDEAKITLRGVEDKPGVAAAIFGPLAESAINVDMIVQNISEDGRTTDITFTVPTADFERSMAKIEGLKSAVVDGEGLRIERRRQGVGDRHRHAQPRRRRGRGVPGARLARHQHPAHHDVGDQDFRY